MGLAGEPSLNTGFKPFKQAQCQLRKYGRTVVFHGHRHGAQYAIRHVGRPGNEQENCGRPWDLLLMRRLTSELYFEILSYDI